MDCPKGNAVTQRQIEALRNLAERPGTEAEGRLARELLERVKVSTLAVGDAVDRLQSVGLSPDEVRAEIRRRFPRGTRVYYNYWTYVENCPGTVTGYPVKPFREDWAWARIKFDYLKSSRAVPVYSAKGWHLSVSPVSSETIGRDGLTGFTDDEQRLMMAEILRKCGFGESWIK
jgi:hypothetical protein